MCCLFVIAICSSMFSLGMQQDEEEAFLTDSSKFMDVVQTPPYADKTAMLRHVFQGTKHKLLLAPRRFFKSTNLDMVKTFASIPVNKRGKRLNANITEVYYLFSKLNVHTDRKMFYKHFGQYPVLHVEFKCDQPVSGSDDVIKIIMRQVHYSYMQHKYLFVSDKLTDQEKQAIKVWSANRLYKSLDKYDVKYGLSDLAAHLYKHYETKVLVLVDEYDSIIVDAMYRLNDQELRDVVDTVTEQISILLSHIYVKRTIVTGVSSTIGVGLTGLDKFSFLDDHPFVDFYGFTKTEVDNLFRNRFFRLDNDMIEEAHARYNAYTSRTGKKIYSPISVLNFLQTGEVRNYWSECGSVDSFQVLTAPAIKEQILKMIKKESIPIEFAVNVSLNDVLKLREPVEHERVDKNIVNLFLTYLFEQGYLCFDEECGSCVKFPNREIEEEVKRKVK